jgi:hypothetical protein
MVKRIRISRHGLTECPSCRQHIRVDDDIAQTSCPFCDESLIDALKNGTSVQLPQTSMMAASLLSLGLAVASCDSGRQMVQPVYGAPSPPADSGTAAPDANAAVDTGAAAVDAGTDPDADIIINDAGHATDAGAIDTGVINRDAAMREDAAPIPPYGIPPEPDSGEPPQRDAQVIIDAGSTRDALVREDAKVDSGPAVTPLYGLPPSRDAQ